MVETLIAEVDLAHSEFQVQEFPPEVETSDFESLLSVLSEAFQSLPQNSVSENRPLFSCPLHVGSWHRAECDTLQVQNELYANRHWTCLSTDADIRPAVLTIWLSSALNSLMR